MQQNFSKFSPTNLNFVWKKLLSNTEYKQKVSEFSLPYNKSALKKCARLGAHNGSEKSETSYVYLILHSSLINTKFKFVGLNFEKFCCVIHKWDRNFQI